MDRCLSRRDLIKSVATGVVAVAAGSVTGCSSRCQPYESLHPTKPLPPYLTNKYKLTEPWQSILEIARRTPSPHNTQPWKLNVRDERRVDLYLDHARALPGEDVTGCFIVCSLGMFAQAFCLVASNLGVNVVFHQDMKIQEAVGFSRMGWFELKKTATAKSPFSNELFLQRQTSRLQLSSELLSQGELATLSTITEKSNHRLLYFSDPDLINALLHANIDALVEDMNDCTYRDEVVRWFRYDQSEAEGKKDGLSADCMSLSPAQFRFFANQPQLAQWPIIGPLIREQYRKSLGGAPQLAVVCGDFFDVRSAFSVGSMFMQLWLAMSERGLYLHPFGNLVTNNRARQRLIALTGAVKPWIVFRFGHSAIPPISYRLNATELCV